MPLAMETPLETVKHVLSARAAHIVTNPAECKALQDSK